MKQFILFLVILTTSSLKSQTHPYKLGLDCLNSGGYYYAISQLEEKKEDYINDPKYKRAYYQILATYYSFIGNDSLAFQSFDKAFSTEDSRTSNRILDTTLVQNLDIEFINAFDFIDSISKTTRLIIINESHHTSQHRILTKEILERLRVNGYNYLGIEALSPIDTNIRDRGYPTILQTGFYTNEPVFGNLIREAFNKGYEVFPYDSEIDCSYDDEKPNYCKNLRELAQAININKFLNENPDSKLLIHCGYDHLFEKTKTDWIKMAEFLKIISNVDPFTINQTKYVERGYLSLEKDEYALFSEMSNIEAPFVCLKNGNIWRPEEYKGYYDLQVYWPRITFLNGRPKYLYLQEEYLKYEIPGNTLKANTIVQAFNKSELLNPVPIDQVIINDIEKKYILILPKGKFTIKVKNKKGVVIDNFDIFI